MSTATYSFMEKQKIKKYRFLFLWDNLFVLSFTTQSAKWGPVEHGQFT